MKIYPEKEYSIELFNESSFAISELKNKTLSENQFVSDFNNQVFIGTIENNTFKIKLSRRLLGEICFLEGKLEDKNGTLKVLTSKIPKIIFVSLILFAVSGIVSAIIQRKFEVLFYIIVFIFLTRYFFLEMSYRITSKIAITELSKIIGIKNLK